MKKESIKTHLKRYSILQERKTTVNHAFASALAPNDNYDEQVMDDALRLLGQNPDDDLTCIYCGAKAQTWDHLIGLVKDSEFQGYGHQIGNLVPCCRDCNSKKGSKDWQQFIESEVKDEGNRKELKSRLYAYLEHYAKPVDTVKMEREMHKELENYRKLKKDIFKLMNAADEIAEKIRTNAR